ncbi:hypothetical protein [Azospirillum doebereinerae]
MARWMPSSKARHRRRFLMPPKLRRQPLLYGKFIARFKGAAMIS